MEKIDVINTIFSSLFISLGVYPLYLKFVDYKNNNYKKNIFVIFLNIYSAILYYFSIKYITSTVFFLFFALLDSIILGHITQNKLDFSILLTTISLAVSYLIYVVSVLVSGIIIYLINSNIENNNPISLLLIPIIQVILFHIFFRIKRIKNGFYFLKNSDSTKSILIFSIFICSIVLSIHSLVKETNTDSLNTYFISIFIIISIVLALWIQKETTLHYKDKMKDRTIQIQETEIENNLQTISNLSNEVKRLASAVHKYNHRLSSLELATKSLISSYNFNEETSPELITLLEDIKTVSKEFADETSTKSYNKPLASTNILSIDNLFKYLQKEATINNINFNLKVNNSIQYLVNKLIPKNKLETLIGDHVKNAIIAINSSNNTYRNIMIILGIINNCYELSIYDSGSEFEIPTLIDLGLKQITTHKDTGGSGIGFITTFETLSTSKASLIIEEFCPVDNKEFTKALTFRFNNKNQYIIKSYRANEIRKSAKDNRIIIEDL